MLPALHDLVDDPIVFGNLVRDFGNHQLFTAVSGLLVVDLGSDG